MRDFYLFLAELVVQGHFPSEELKTIFKPGKNKILNLTNPDDLNPLVFVDQFYFTSEGTITDQELDILESLFVENFARRGLIRLSPSIEFKTGTKITPLTLGMTMSDFTGGKFNGPAVL